MLHHGVVPRTPQHASQERGERDGPVLAPLAPDQNQELRDPVLLSGPQVRFDLCERRFNVPPTLCVFQHGPEGSAVRPDVLLPILEEARAIIEINGAAACPSLVGRVPLAVSLDEDPRRLGQMP